jgi:hypothetical protein
MSSKKAERMSVAERFRKQMDLLTGDKESIPKNLHQPLIPLPPSPPKKLTKSQILSLYNIPFACLLD